MTIIHIKENTRKKLLTLKKPGETMDDVVQKLLELTHGIPETTSNLDNSNQSSFDDLLEEFCTIANEELQQVIMGSKRSFQKGITRDIK